MTEIAIFSKLNIGLLGSCRENKTTYRCLLFLYLESTVANHDLIVWAEKTAHWIKHLNVDEVKVEDPYSKLAPRLATW